jgi:hypothetical protein
MVKEIYFIFSLESNDYLWLAHHVQMGGFASKVGHPRSDLVKLLIYNGIRQYLRQQYCTTGLTG